jgi:hypothetical protein
MSCVERVVRCLQQGGDHERRVSAGHRHDSNRKPAGWSYARDQGAERHAAERREQNARALAEERAAIGPGQNEQRHDQQRQARAGAVHQPAKRKRGKHGDRNERDICQRLGTTLFSQRTHSHEADDRERRHERPQAAAHARDPRGRPGAR